MHRLAFILSLPLFALSCKQPDPPPVQGTFRDDFERAAIGGDYAATAQVYRIKDGALNVQSGYNHPLWLRKKIPVDATIELDVRSSSDAGDIKVEIWGDGEGYAVDNGAYTSSGYVFIMGGWRNTKSIIARGNEHGSDVQARTQPRVEMGKTYHWKIVRKGRLITWYVDDLTTPFLTFDDADPYTGSNHAYFGFNNWEADVWYDNLVISETP